MKLIDSLKVYFDEDADVSIIKEKIIGVIGYGNQGRAWALNMRDSGLNVVVGNVKDSYWDQAKADGFNVLSINEAAAKADIICLLIPDEVIPEVYDLKIRDNLKPGKILCFASGYNIAFGLVKTPEYVKSILVAPRMIGKGVRELFLAGSGAPALIAAEDDDSLRIALAISKALGFTRVGVFESTFREEAICDLISEQVVGAATSAILRLAFEMAVKEGVRPEIEVLELYASGELVEIWKSAAEVGLLNQMKFHSIVSQYGQLSRQERFMIKELRKIVGDIVSKIVSGEFTKELLHERESGYSRLHKLYEEASQHPMIRAEQRVLKILRRCGHEGMLHR
ncbi:MAG: ketol-acid reductoisomerase [Thaumarchaeota archaeon]|nr:MAG: ketol-acid reductoisomerase [Nitrososphaerota archaeon]